MTLLSFAISNLARRRTRTLLTMLGIALATATAVTLLSLSGGITKGITEGLNERSAEIVVASRTTTDVLNTHLPEDARTDLLEIPGVISVRGELYTFTVSGDGRQLLVGGWSVDAPAWRTLPLAAGRSPVPGKSEVVVGDLLAETLGLSIGEKIVLFDQPFVISGITGYSSYINRSVIFMFLPTLQDASFREGQVSFFSVALAPALDDAGQQRVRGEIANRLPVVASDAGELLQSDRNLTILRAVAVAVSIIAFVMGGLQLFGTMLLSVQERTREIGLLVAIGWTDADIVLLLVLEAIAMSSGGTLIGVVLGLATNEMLTVLPAIGTLIDFKPILLTIVKPVAAGMAVAALGAAVPAWRATRLAPAMALKHG